MCLYSSIYLVCLASSSPQALLSCGPDLPYSANPHRGRHPLGAMLYRDSGTFIVTGPSVQLQGQPGGLRIPLASTPAAYPDDLHAWFCPGAFDIASDKWEDCSGNGNTATLSGSDLAELRSAEHGATTEVLALSGTTSSVIKFGTEARPVIPNVFTVCSVTRYMGAAQGRILHGSGNWLHGHDGGDAGVADYGGSNGAWNLAHEQCNMAHATGNDADCCTGSDIAQQCECARISDRGRRRELSPFHEDTRGRELGHCCDHEAYCNCSTLAHAKPNPSLTRSRNVTPC